jgi:LPS export ABC transporter protein LptC
MNEREVDSANSILSRKNIDSTFAESNLHVRMIAKQENDSVFIKTSIDSKSHDSVNWKSDTTFQSRCFNQGIDIIITCDTMKSVVEIKAGYAIFDPKNETIEFKNNIVVTRTISDDSIFTEHLIWDLKKHKFETDGMLKVSDPKNWMTGKGLESDETFTNYEIKEILSSIHLHDQ